MVPAGALAQVVRTRESQLDASSPQRALRFVEDEMTPHSRWIERIVVLSLLAIPQVAFAQSVEAPPSPPSASEPSAETPSMPAPAEAAAPPRASDVSHVIVVLDAQRRLSVTHRDAQGNMIWQTPPEDSDPLAAVMLTFLFAASVPREPVASPPTPAPDDGAHSSSCAPGHTPPRHSHAATEGRRTPHDAPATPRDLQPSRRRTSVVPASDTPSMGANAVITKSASKTPSP